jgi:hypothetical protein
MSVYEPPIDSRDRWRATRSTVYDPWEPFRRTLLAGGEFYRGLAEASAESFRAFNAALETPRVESRGLTCSVFEGMAEGNAQFYETLAKSSRRIADILRPVQPEPAPTVTEEVDYERLARLVALELKNLEQQGKDREVQAGL